MNFLLLAAGRGQRMGVNKSLMLFHGEPWVEFQIRQIKEAGIDKILIISNPESAESLEEITFRHKNVQIFVNSKPDLGPFSSLQIAIRENEEQSAFVSPMDVPLRAATLSEMKEAWHKLENKKDVLVPSYNKHKGHPVILSGSLQKKLKDLDVEEPTSRLDYILRHLPEDRLHLHEATDPFVMMNLNTPEDLEALMKMT